MNIPETRLTKAAGTLLHCLATTAYLVALLMVFEFVLEIWKGVQLLRFIGDWWITFGGSREVLATGILAVIVGRIIDLGARALNRRFARARGWRDDEA